MKKFVSRMVALAVLGGIVAVFTGTVDAEDKKTQTIKECMSCQNKMKGAINTAVKGEKWDDASKSAKTWLTAAKDLGECKPPKGDEESWKKHAKKYLETVTAVSEGVDKKDKDAVDKAIKSVDCGGCHGAHKPKK